jgi:thiamine pyrophosphokinase
MIVHIFANGPYQTKLASVIFTEKKGDLVIAADGGAGHCRQLNITPHIVVGDLDSLAPVHIEEYTQAGVEVIDYPTRKDETDLELAIDLAMTKGADEVILFGALGGRWDMSMSNVLLAASKKYSQMIISLANDGCRMHIVHGGTNLLLDGEAGQTVSLIAMSSDVQGITIRGFEYPLNNETLPFGSSRGVSNLLKESKGSITLESGTLLCVQERTAPDKE